MFYCIDLINEVVKEYHSGSIDPVKKGYFRRTKENL